MKKRLGLAAASMASIRVPSRLPGVLATLGAPIVALVKKRGNRACHPHEFCHPRGGLHRGNRRLAQ
jgi:hypothetical protein